MDRLLQATQRLAGLLLVCAVAFGAARSSVLGDHSWMPVAIALGVSAYVGWRGWRLVRRIIPKRSARQLRTPTLPARAHWLSPRNLQRRGRP
jgi:hypothetical protein